MNVLVINNAPFVLTNIMLTVVIAETVKLSLKDVLIVAWQGASSVNKTTI